MVRSDCQAIRVAAVRPFDTVFYCKDGRQIVTNVDSPTLGGTACVDTVSHLSLSHRARFRVTASSTLTSYLWMHVKLPYPPPHRVGFRNSFHLIRTLTFCGTNPAWLNTDQIQGRILLSERPASSSCCLLLCVREGWEGRRTCSCLDLL